MCKYVQSIFKQTVKRPEKNHDKKNLQLDEEFHKDIQWFVKFMPQFKGTTFFILDQLLPHLNLMPVSLV